MKLQSLSLMLLIILFFGTFVSAKPAFDAKPTVKAEEKSLFIQFSATEKTPVTVEIIDNAGRIIRHLAAGMLGPKPPLPFQPGLNQRIRWDRKDDKGTLVTGKCSVRVGLGLEAKYDRILGWSGPLHGRIVSLVSGKNGMIHIIHVGARRRGYPPQAFFSAYDRSGKYLGTQVPHDPALTESEAHNLRLVDFKGVGRVPSIVNRMTTKAIPSIYPKGYGYKGKTYPESYGMPQTAAWSPELGIIMIRASEDGARLIAVAADSTVSPGPKLPDKPGEKCHVALLQDKTIIVSSEGKLFRGKWGQENLVLFKDALKAIKKPGAVAAGPDGRLHVVDRENGRIAVLDENGKETASAETGTFEQIAVDPGTGVLYALTHDAILQKRSSVKQGAEILSALNLAAGGKVSCCINGAARPPLIWAACTPEGARPELWRIEDQGGRLKKTKVITYEEHRMAKIFRIAAHPERDEIYLKRYFGGKVKKSGNILRMDGMTGKITRIPVTAHEIAVDAEGHLYGTYNRIPGPEGPTPGPVTHVRKYDREGQPLPINGKEEGFTFPSQIRGSGEGGRGFTVAPDGDIYILHYDPYDQGRPKPHYGPGPVWLSVFGPDGKRKKWHFTGGFTQGASGIAVAKDGSIYVADAIKPVSALYPEAYRHIGMPDSTIDVCENAPKMPNEPWLWDGQPNWYFMLQGTLLKFGPKGGALWWQRGFKTEEPPKFEGPANYWRIRMPGIKNYDLRSAPVRVKGEQWAYFGISPVPQGSGGGFGFSTSIFGTSHTKHCVCHQTRFALDRHNRLIFTDALRFSVLVMDSEMNELLRFGGFSTLRSYGHGSPVPQQPLPAISFAWVAHVAVNDHAVYLSDPIHRRIIKVKLGYQKEAILGVP